MKSANMIFMGVRNHNTNDLVTHRAKRGYIRTDHVDTRGGRVVTKGDPDVYQQILAFTTVHVEVHPNLTPHPEKGLGQWSTEDIVLFLSNGQKPDGTFADHNQVMAEKIEDSYSFFSDADKRAIAAYLKALPPNDFDPSTYNP